MNNIMNLMNILFFVVYNKKSHLHSVIKQNKKLINIEFISFFPISL